MKIGSKEIISRVKEIPVERKKLEEKFNKERSLFIDKTGADLYNNFLTSTFLHSTEANIKQKIGYDNKILNFCKALPQNPEKVIKVINREINENKLSSDPGSQSYVTSLHDILESYNTVENAKKTIFDKGNPKTKALLSKLPIKDFEKTTKMIRERSNSQSKNSPAGHLDPLLGGLLRATITYRQKSKEIEKRISNNQTRLSDVKADQKKIRHETHILKKEQQRLGRELEVDGKKLGYPEHPGEKLIVMKGSADQTITKKYQDISKTEEFESYVLFTNRNKPGSEPKDVEIEGKEVLVF